MEHFFSALSQSNAEMRVHGPVVNVEDCNDVMWCEADDGVL